MGEYVFDHSWAHAYENAGGSYYPKLQVAVPFTPVTGRRLLVAPDAPPGARGNADRALCAACATRSRPPPSMSPSPSAADAEALGAAGFARRTGEQFHFLNEGYADFEAFLAALSSRKRKTIKRERREALGDDIEIDLLTGNDIKSKPLGRVLRLLHGHRLAQMGPALSDPRLLHRDRRDDGGPGAAGDGAARAGGISPGRSIFSARTRSTAATGARSRSGRSCISRSAIIRRSNTPSATVMRASRRARRASTSWRAAIGPSRPIPRMISPIPASPAPCAIISCASARRSTSRSPITRRACRSGRGTSCGEAESFDPGDGIRYSEFMTQLLDRAIEVARALPERAQDEIARLILAAAKAKAIRSSRYRTKKRLRSMSRSHRRSAPSSSATAKCAPSGRKSALEHPIHSARLCRTD